MKKIYLLSMLLLAVSATGQELKFVPTQQKQKKNVQSNSGDFRSRIGSLQNPPTSSAIIWADDFSIPSKWVITHEPGTTSDWVIGANPPSGPLAIDPINSSTSVNGFALFDSDLLCDTVNGQVGNLTLASPVDLTGYADVRLTFSQFYRRYFDSTYVFISTDGNTWTKFEVNGNITINQYNANDPSLNPEIVNIDISSAAGNQDSVYVRFQFYSPHSLDTNFAGCAYAWMIDDVSISEIPATDAKIVTPTYAGEYSVIPVGQPESFKMRGKIINNGNQPLSGARINFMVFDGAVNMLYFDSSGASGTVNPGDTSVFLTSTGTYALPDTGIYYVLQTVSLSGDGDLTNDTAIATIYVSDSTYARDYTALFGTGFLGGFGSNLAPITLAQKYTVYHAAQFTSATFFLAAPPIGDDIQISVYDQSAGLPNTQVGTTAVYTITVNDTGGKLITLPFSSPINVVPGNYYVALHQLDSHNISLGASEEIFTAASSYFKGSGAWTALEAANFRMCFMLRVNTPSSTVLGINNISKNALFEAFPNPTNGIIRVNGISSVSRNVNINVISSTGKILKSLHYKEFTGENIDLSDFPAGIYNIRISSSEGIENISVVLQ